MLAPRALGKRDPILRYEFGELCGEQPAQDLRTLRKIARDGELSHIALDLQQSPRLDDGTDVVEDDPGNSGRPRYRQHHREYAAMGSADEYGWRDRERGQDRREIGEVDAKCIIIGIAVVFGLAVAAIVGRHDPARLGRVGRQRHCQGMKVGCSPGETR